MAANLARARDQERQFLLSISHDLRTPLTSIRGYAEAIGDGAVDDLPRATGIVATEAARLERLIRDLLDLAKLEARQFSLKERASELNGCIAKSVEALRLEFDAAGVALHLELLNHPVVTVVDPDRLAQVLANLIENALKFAQRRVDVRLAEARGEALVLSVEDDGPGIAPEDLPHVFERLFTSTRRGARAAGSGLGLAIVAELAQAMGARIEVTSPVGSGRGTRFSLMLPRRAPGREPGGSGSVPGRPGTPFPGSIRPNEAGALRR